MKRAQVFTECNDPYAAQISRYMNEILNVSTVDTDDDDNDDEKKTFSLSSFLNNLPNFQWITFCTKKTNSKTFFYFNFRYLEQTTCISFS